MKLVLQFLEEGKIQILSRTHSNGEELERAEQFGALLIGEEVNQVDALLAGDADVETNGFRCDLADYFAGVILSDFRRICSWVFLADFEVVFEPIRVVWRKEMLKVETCIFEVSKVAEAIVADGDPRS